MSFITDENSDNLNLKIFSFEKETINSEDDIIRNLKDENGRLMKLLQEKDFEMNKLKRDYEKYNVKNSEKATLGEGAAAMKIIELSKKLREMTSEIESIKSKYSQKLKENKNLEINLAQLSSSNEKNVSLPTHETFEELKHLKEKLKCSETKVLELLTTNQNLSKDYKIIMKVLEDEIGDPNFDVNKLLNSPSNWKGRSQKIISLNQQIEKLKKQIKEAQENDSISFCSYDRDICSGATSIGLENANQRLPTTRQSNSVTISSKQNDILIKMQRDKQQNVIKQEQEYNALKEDHVKLKQTCDSLKSRNQSLTNDIKSYKLQIKTMLDKTKNDDELIASLIQRQDQLKMTIQSLISNSHSVQINSTYEMTQAAAQSKQDIDTIEKLKEIIELKELEIKSMKESKGMVEEMNKDLKNPVNVDFEQLKICSRSMELEISQLRQLITTNDMRYQSILDKSTKMAEENSQLRQSCLQLEREIQKLYPNSKFKSKCHSASARDQLTNLHLSVLLSPEAPVTKETILDLQSAMCLQIDKIDSLNNALQLMSSAKQDDIAVLTEIIDRTRLQFVESIKKLKTDFPDNRF